MTSDAGARRSVDDRGPDECSKLTAGVAVDGTEAWFGRRSPRDSPAGVTDASLEMRESHSALTCSSGQSVDVRSTVR